MFIEQIFSALYKKSELKMSSGNQIREYHHVDDEVNAISKILDSGFCGIIQVNAGNAIPIKDLAHGVFNAFGFPQLIHHDRSLDYDDVFSEPYMKEPMLSDVFFREPIAGVTSYLKAKLITM